MSIEREIRPPLTTRMRPGHWLAIDFVVGALLGLFGVLTAAHEIVTLPSQFLLAAVIIFPVGLRRRYPLPAYGALVILAILAIAIGVAVPAGPTFVFVAAAFVLFTLTVRCSRAVGLAALAVPLAVIMVTQILAHTHRIPPDRAGPGSVGVAFVVIMAWMTGYSARQRRRYAQALQHEAARTAVAGERLRIARELHDVVAHSMSVIAVQAGYGQYVIDTSPAGARAALGAIQATSRDALEEMRRMLGVLRQPDQPDPPGEGERTRPAPVPLTPAPGLHDLGRLLERTRGAGVEVSLERSGRVRAVPAGVGLSAYRIIQEALTNVVRHAGDGARCTVRLGYGQTALEVLVADDGGRRLVPAVGVSAAGACEPAGSGHGLVGMRERAQLCGGEFTAGPLPEGGFRVTATLPLPGGPGEGGLS